MSTSLRTNTSPSKSNGFQRTNNLISSNPRNSPSKFNLVALKPNSTPLKPHQPPLRPNSTPTKPVVVTKLKSPFKPNVFAAKLDTTTPALIPPRSDVNLTANNTGSRNISSPSKSKNVAANSNIPVNPVSAPQAPTSTKQIITCKGCNHECNVVDHMRCHIYKNCPVFSSSFCSKIDPSLGHEERRKMAYKIINDNAAEYFNLVKPTKKKKGSKKEKCQQNEPVEEQKKKEELFANPLVEILVDTQHNNHKNSSVKQSTSKKRIHQTLIHDFFPKKNKDQPPKKKIRIEEPQLPDFSNLLKPYTLLLIRILDDKYLLSDLNEEMQNKFIEIKDILKDIINKSNANRRKEKKSKITLESLLQQIPKELLFFVKHLLVTDSHEKKRIRPLINLAKRHKTNPLNAKEKSKFHTHLSSVRRRLCSAVMLSNMFVNAGCCKEATSLKLIATIALREENLTNSGLSTLQRVGLTHSNNNYLNLFEKKEEVKGMLKEKIEEIKPTIENKTFAVVSDNNFFPIEKHHLGAVNAGVNTISNGIFALMNPKESTLKAPKEFVPIKNLSPKEFSQICFKKTQQEEEAWKNCWQEHLDTVVKHRSLFHYKNEPINETISKIKYFIIESKIGSDAGAANNVLNIKYLNKFFKTSFGLDIEKENRLHVSDQKGTSAISKVMYGIKPNKRTTLVDDKSKIFDPEFKKTFDENELLRTSIHSHPYPG